MKTILRPDIGTDGGGPPLAGRRRPQRTCAAGLPGRLSGYLNPRLDLSGMVEHYVCPIPGPEPPVICEIRGTHGKLTGSVRAPAG